MMNLNGEIERAEAHRRDLLRQATIERLMREAQRDTPTIQKRLLLLLSDLMIAGGTELKARSAAKRLSQPTSTYHEIPLELVTRR